MKAILRTAATFLSVFTPIFDILLFLILIKSQICLAVNYFQGFTSKIADRQRLLQFTKLQRLQLTEAICL